MPYKPRPVAQIEESIQKRCAWQKQKRERERNGASVDALRALAARGMCQADAVRALGLPQPFVSKLARRHGIAFARCERVSAHPRYEFTPEDRAKSGRARRNGPERADVEADVRERRARALRAACERAGIAPP